jgi:hypothetical protein
MLNKKYLCSVDDKNFTIRSISTAEEVGANPDALRMLDNLQIQCEKDAHSRLLKEGKALTTLHDQDYFHSLIKFDRAWADKTFNGNQHLFLIEENDKIACVILININEKRQALNVPESVGTFIYVGDVITSEEYKNCRLFSTALDKIITTLSNPKKNLPQPILYSISVSGAEAIKDDIKFTHVMNLDRYNNMWHDRFINNVFQIRLQELEGLKRQEGIDRFPANYCEQYVSNLIDSFKPMAAKQGKRVRGVYLEGESRGYKENKEQRARLLEGRPNVSFKPLVKQQLKEEHRSIMH